LTLTQKETSLLTDLKKAEELCIEKYQKYSNEACDPELKNLFSSLKGVEQQQPPANAKAAYGMGNADPNKVKDSYLCSDQLSTEKHVSALYDTCIFEFKDVNARNALNHIQKEEQEHGEKIYAYMAKNNMYS